MMKNWKKKLLAVTLLLSLAMPASVRGESGASLHPKEQGLHVEHKRFQHGVRLDIHRQMYFILLAEKYTPESVNQWREAFAERARLLGELRELREKEKEGNSQKQALREQFKQKAEELHKKVDRGEMTHEQMKQQLKEWRQAHFPEMRNEEKASHETMRENREEFNQVIASGDAAKIKAVLPKLLADMQTLNKRLADKVGKRKAG